MATYIVSEEITIARQEGDTSEIVFTVPDLLGLSPFTEVKFQTKKNPDSNTVIDKSVSTGGIAVEGQVITVALLVADTKGKIGRTRWELELSNLTEVITIGKGVFEITRELIK